MVERQEKKLEEGGKESESYVVTECSGTILGGVRYFERCPTSGTRVRMHLTFDIF